MSIITRGLVKILQCDKRYFTLTGPRWDEIEKVVKEYATIERQYDEIREKHQYFLKLDGKTILFESKNRGDALGRLIIYCPFLYEPVRVKYNEMVKERFMPARDKRQEKIEKRYQRRMEMIRRLSGG